MSKFMVLGMGKEQFYEEAARSLEREKAEIAYEKGIRLAKMAMYAGCYGEPFPDEILNMRGGKDGAIAFLHRYYEAGSAIRRRTTTQHTGSAVMRPDDGKTNPPH
jgi:hypothetical protein